MLPLLVTFLPASPTPSVYTCFDPFLPCLYCYSFILFNFPSSLSSYFHTHSLSLFSPFLIMKFRVSPSFLLTFILIFFFCKRLSGKGRLPKSMQKNSTITYESSQSSKTSQIASDWKFPYWMTCIMHYIINVAHKKTDIFCDIFMLVFLSSSSIFLHETFLEIKFQGLGNGPVHSTFLYLAQKGYYIPITWPFLDRLVKNGMNKRIINSSF